MTTAIEQSTTLAPATQATQSIDAPPPPPPAPPPPADPPDPIAIVRGVFRDAVASNSRLGGRWCITVPEFHGTLGDGASEAGAWADAAEAVEQARQWGWGGQRRAKGKGAGR